MKAKFIGVAAVLAVGVGCAASPDPRNGPGCDPSARRCDGDVLQLCVLRDSRYSDAVWVDVDDCSRVAEGLTCVEQASEDGERADCAEVDAVDKDAGEVRAEV